MENAEYDFSQPVTCSDSHGHNSSLSQESRSIGHNYPSIKISGRAQVHLGDQYHYAAPEDQIERAAASLHFAEIHSRYDNIDDAHSKTFEWIFEPPRYEAPPWDSFVDWLKNKEPFYWVSGKPGSGKSTLMKYLVNSVQVTRQKDQTAPLVLSVWFWEPGKELEHSFVGCVRSLLWHLLRDIRSEDAAIHAIEPVANENWTKRRLTGSLLDALKKIKDVPLFIFLDGLDEAGTEAEDIIDLSERLVKEVPGLKICISSRPEQVFVDAFSDYPKLRIQDLNAADIDVIIAEELLNNHKVLNIISNTDQPNLLKLTSSIKDMAEGVILWVKLVIRSLVTGIRNRDSINILQHRLEELPKDLDSLYEYMLRRNNNNTKHYTDAASLYCNMIMEREMSLLQFCLAIDDDMRRRFLDPETGWNMTTVKTDVDCERVITWINVRAAGLIEVIRRPSDLDERRSFWGLGPGGSRCPPLTQFLDVYGNCQIKFIHRTARTYLLDTSSGLELLSACQITAEELAQIDFESYFAIYGVLYSLEGPRISPDHIWLATGHDVFIEDMSISCLPFERICNALVQRKYSSVECCWMPGMGSKHHGRKPFPSSRGSAIDFCKLYCMFAVWDEAQCVLDRLDYQRTVDGLSELLVFVAHGISQHQVPRREGGTKIFLRLIEDGADPICTIVSPNNEDIWLFPYLALWLDGYVSSTITNFVLELDSEYTHKSIPTMSSCSEIFWNRDLFIMRPMGDSITQRDIHIWGDFCVSDMKETLRNDNIFSEMPIANYPSRAYVICDAYKDDSAPVLYPVSFSDSQQILSYVRKGEMAKDEEPTAVVGIIDLWINEDGEDRDHVRFIRDIQRRSTPFCSLVEAFEFMGKSRESIRKWAVAEEAKLLHNGESEDDISRWKSWVFGTGN